jgi:2-isopropylmalate synthase
VLTSHSDIDSSWGSVGVHQNIIDASWTALSDGLLVGLMRARARKNNDK